MRSSGNAVAAAMLLAGGRPVVFFCASAKCWLSYNAALRAVALGYTEVHWYRGGIEAWIDGGGELRPMRMAWRAPPDLDGKMQPKI